ncbi:hypothetical protein [Nocardia sp. NPDC052566]|uniref:hypothetical protein n=1 Tax=Nocardia sp. NPDC052566 TaxID=3364330 RepID=UPI0037CC1DCC
MTTTALADDITDVVQRGDGWVRGYRVPTSGDGGQFLIVLKPEFTAAIRRGTAPLHRTFELLADSDVTIGGVRVASTEKLAALRFIEGHYPVLNRVSRLGLSAVPRNVLHRLAHDYPDIVTASKSNSRQILGGHQLLEVRPDLTPLALDTLARNLPITKIASGVYASRIVLDEQPLLVLNAFHPCQLEHFHRPGGSLVFLTCHTSRRTDELRREVIGATDPAQACPGSVKHLLYALRPWQVCTRLNGIHISPGPIEAMFTIQRYFAEDWAAMPLTDTQLGRELRAAGIDLEQVQRLSDNPMIEQDGLLFDLGEDRTTAESIELLRRIVGDRRS